MTDPRRAPSRGALAWAALALVLPAGLGGQLAPEEGAPLRQFRLPAFGEDGNRAWLLSGDVGRPVAGGALDVEGLRLQVFAAGGREVQSEIRAPLARLEPGASRASGDGPIVVETPQFKLAGSRWTWDGPANRVTVAEGAITEFRGGIGNLLQ